MKESLHDVAMYCDGSCLDNGSESAVGGYGVLLKSSGVAKEVFGGISLERVTNNIAEIIAIIKGFQELKMLCRVKVHTDSEYIVKIMKGENEPKANMELIQQLWDECGGHEVEWIHTSDSDENLAKCHNMAIEAAKEEQAVEKEAETEEYMRMIGSGLSPF